MNFRRVLCRSGMYATSINSQNQFTKNKQPLPGSVIPVTEYFRRAGYFVTSSKGPKMDGGYYSGYNFAHNPGDQYDGQARRNRAAGQPFFSQEIGSAGCREKEGWHEKIGG